MKICTYVCLINNMMMDKFICKDRFGPGDLATLPVVFGTNETADLSDIFGKRRPGIDVWRPRILRPGNKEEPALYKTTITLAHVY